MGFGVGFVLFVVATLVSEGARGQSTAPACASKLVQCAQYLNTTTKPPDDCCNPLRQEITNDLKCLCDLYSNQDLFKQLRINLTQAIGLPKLCGINNGGLDACKTLAPSPSGGVTPPAGTPGSNNACGSTWIGMSGLTGLLLLWASMMV